MIYRVVVLVVTVCLARAEDVVYIVNSLDESLGWIDHGTHEFDDNAATLGYIPNDVLASENHLFVVNSGNNNIQMIDRRTFETIRLLELPGVLNPWAADMLNDGRLAVTGSLSGTLSIVNPSTGEVDTTFVVGRSPQFVQLLWSDLYVLCTGVEWPEFNQGTLKRYSSETFELVDSVVVGVNPQSAAFIWVGYFEAHVLCTGNYNDVEGSIFVVNLENSMFVEDTITVGGSPGAIAAGNGVGWIAAGGWDEEGYLYRYLPYTREFTHGHDNPIITGGGATDVFQQSYVGGGVWVSCFSDATVEFRSNNGELGYSIPMGQGTSAITTYHWFEDVSPGYRPTPASLEVLSAYPNPFNGLVFFKWTGQINAPNTIKISDIMGRDVANLAVETNARTAVWAPGTGGAQEVAAGVYFARFGDGRVTQPIRVVYLK